MDKLGRNPLERQKANRTRRTEFLDAPKPKEPQGTLERIKGMEIQFDSQNFMETVVLPVALPALSAFKKWTSSIK